MLTYEYCRACETHTAHKNGACQICVVEAMKKEDARILHLQRQAHPEVEEEWPEMGCENLSPRKKEN